MIWLHWILGGTVVLLSFLLFAKRTRDPDLPPLVPGYPIFGNFFEFYYNPKQFFTECKQRGLGNIFSFFLGGKMVTLLGEKDAFHLYYTKGPADVIQTSRIFEVVFGDEIVKLVTSSSGEFAEIQDDGERWLNQWRGHVLEGLKPQYRQNYFRFLLPLLQEEIKSCEGQVINGYDFFQRSSVRFVAKISLGTHSNTHFKDFARLRFDVQKYMETAAFPIGAMKLKIFSSMKNIANAPKELHGMFFNLITEARGDPNFLAKISEEDDAMFGVLLRRGSLSNGVEVDADKMAFLFVFFVIAASLNMDSTTFWTFYNIVTNKKIYDDVMRELDGINEITYESVDQLPLLQNCVKESVRMGLGPLGVRIVVRDQIYKKHKLPKGSMIGVSSMFTHFNENLYDHPREFDPYRYTNPKETEEARNLSKYNYIGFGHGIHHCIGENLAYMVISAVVGYLLKNCDVDIITKEPVKMKQEWGFGILPPVSPFQFRLNKK